MITTNVSNNTQVKFSAHRNMKLSPDCVGSPSLLGSPTALALDELVPLRRDDLNDPVPPLHTPMKSKPKPKIVLHSRDNSRLLQIPSGAPQLPPRCPITKQCPRSVRSVSEGEACRSNTRRAIFGQYWNNKARVYSTSTSTASGMGDDGTSSNNASEVLTPLPPKRVRKRSTSMSILESSTLPPEIIDYRMFAPTKEHAHQSAICSRFASVEAVPTLETLPPLPSPLRRLCHDGNTTGCLPGMYPLVTPVPILRQSSYRSLFGNKGSASPGAGRNQNQSTFSDSFNLTKSVGLHDKVFNLETQSTSSSSNAESSFNKSGVSFDPRVTVTEFEDQVERSWYSEVELERLKHETILLAQEYLLTHSEVAEKYNRTRLDPITGTYRKKALFSLPVLSSVLDDSLPSPNRSGYRDLLKSQVKNILIVDPNTAILNLFCKSMHSMFPDARLTTAQNGEEALKLVSTELRREYGMSPFQHRNFDIIVVEQRLHRSLQAQQKPATCEHQQGSSHLLPQNKSMTEIDHYGSAAVPVLHKPNSFNEGTKSQAYKCINICGSELLKAIHEMEAQTFPLPHNHHRVSSSTEASSISTKPFHGRALLIGVSIQPDRDAKTLQEAGADVIWGKPIPHVGDALRNQLLNALICKRRRSLAGGR
jgi:hypothetical protein